MIAALASVVLTAIAAPQSAPYAAIRVTAVLKVIHPDEARKTILEEAKQRGGLPQLIEDRRVIVRVPPATVEGLVDSIAKEGLLIDRSLAREDLGQKIAQLEASLRAKTETLDALRKFITETNAETTIQIERQLIALAVEIEQVKGGLRVERERGTWAFVEVCFDFPEQQAHPARASSFEWINTVDIGNFVEGF